MNCCYVRENYGVPACIGRRILFRDKKGIIVEDRGNYIGVNFDKDKPNKIYSIHPTDNVEYLGMGKIRKMTRSQKRYIDYLKVAEYYESFSAYLGISR